MISKDIISAAPYNGSGIPEALLSGNFLDSTDHPDNALTVGYQMERAKNLLRQEKFEEAFKVLLACSEKHPNAPDWQRNDLQELTTKAMAQAESLLSAEELERIRRRLSGGGLRPQEYASPASKLEPLS